MKIVLTLDLKRELLFNMVLQAFDDGKMDEVKLAKMCFDQGLERVAKVVSNEVISKAMSDAFKPKKEDIKKKEEEKNGKDKNK